MPPSIRRRSPSRDRKPATAIIPINHHTPYRDNDGCTAVPLRYFKNANVGG
jgi:hypothetical protein